MCLPHIMAEHSSNQISCQISLALIDFVFQIYVHICMSDVLEVFKQVAESWSSASGNCSHSTYPN